MPILTVSDDLLRPAQVAQPESSAGEQFRALFSEMSVSGLLGASTRAAALEEAEGGFGEGMRASRSGIGDITPRTLSPMLTPEAARTKLRDAGLSESLTVPQTGIRAAALDILIQRKRAEIRRQTILSRPGASWPARLAGGFLGALVDPTNVALAFVPIVGEAKYAQLLAQQASIIGRTGVRLGVGAAEGTVGLLPGEIANYAANVQQQADYDAYDFMVSIAGGAAFGSILHAGAGLFPEALGRYRRPTTAERLDRSMPGAAVAQRAALDPAARERLMVMERLADGLPVTKRQAEALRVETEGEAVIAIEGRIAEIAKQAEDGRLAPEAIDALVREADDLDEISGRLTVDDQAVADRRLAEIKAALEKHEQSVVAADALKDVEGRYAAALGERQRTGKDATLRALADDLSPAHRDASAFVESLSPAIRRALESDPFIGIRSGIARAQPETQAAAFRMAAAQMARGEPIDVTPAFLADPAYRDVAAGAEAARRNAGRVDGANEQASAWADSIEPVADDLEGLRTLVREDEADVMASLKAGGRELSDDEAEALNADIAQARLDGNAAKAAALCMMRTGG